MSEGVSEKENSPRYSQGDEQVRDGMHLLGQGKSESLMLISVENH